jgi:hypothetical protein
VQRGSDAGATTTCRVQTLLTPLFEKVALLGPLPEQPCYALQRVEDTQQESKDAEEWDRERPVQKAPHENVALRHRVALWGEDKGPQRPMPSGQHLRLVPRCRSSWLLGLPGAPRSISSLGGGEDRGRFAGNRRQRSVVKIPNAVCGACFPQPV